MISYNEQTDQYSVSVSSGNYTLPIGVEPQYKLDPIGYFITYIEDNLVIRIPLKDYEYEEIHESIN
jgi:hypothetical protein